MNRLDQKIAWLFGILVYGLFLIVINFPMTSILNSLSMSGRTPEEGERNTTRMPNHSISELRQFNRRDNLEWENVPASAVEEYQLPWDVLDAGGGWTYSQEYTIGASIGQTAIGCIQSANYKICAGYWSGTDYPLPPFAASIKKVYAYPGQQHVRVPVFICNRDPIGGWEILMNYDITCGNTIGVEVCDSVFVDDPEHYGWHYAPWAGHPELRPEYFNYILGADGHEDRVRITGLMNMPWPQDSTPPIPPGQQQLLLCLVFDVSPLWDGHEVIFGFQTTDCGDNVLTSADGYTTWGPDTLSAPDWSCPQRPESLRIVRLTQRAGIGIREISDGDLNCNTIPYEIGDAVVFINYLVYGEDALCKEACQFEGCIEFQTEASDINGDGYTWTVADLVMMLNIINGHDYPTSTASSVEPVEVELSSKANRVIVSSTSNSSIGAALFIIKYPQDLTIGTPKATERLEDMEVVSSARNGEIKVLVYSMENNYIEAGTGALVIIPVKEREIRSDIETKASLTLVDASFSDPYGRLLPVGEVASVQGVQTSGEVDIPRVFKLEQSCPNPFTTRTTISFSIPKDAWVTLKVYNLTGQLVEILVDEPMSIGYHKVDWDARDVPSGLYFYRIQADEYTATKRMIIIR